jgi:hypothetical protein
VRRPLAAAITMTVVIGTAVAGTARPAAADVQFRLLESGGGRLAADVTSDGRFVLTIPLAGGERRVIDRSTGTVEVLPPEVDTAVVLSDNGRSVPFNTTAQLVPADADSTVDGYVYHLDTGSYELVTPGNSGRNMTVTAIDETATRTLVQRNQDGTGLAPDRAFVSEGGVLAELGAALGPTQSRAVALSSDGRYALFRKETCSNDPTCLGIFAMWRTDLLTNTTVPMGRGTDGAPHDAFSIAMSADGSCVAYVTLSPRAVWKDCGFTAGSPERLASDWSLQYPQGVVSISSDGATVGWLQNTLTEGPLPGTVQGTHLHARTGMGTTVVLAQPSGALPWGGSSGGFVVDADTAIINMTLTNLVPSSETHVVLVRDDHTTTPPPTGSAAQDMVVHKQGGALILTQQCGVFGRLPRTADIDAGEFAELAEVVPAGDASVATDGNQSCAIELGVAKLVDRGSREGQFYVATGRINQLSVTDTRSSNRAWTVSGSVTRFTNGSTGANDSFSGSFLGWRPVVTHASGGSQQVNPGPVVDPSPTDGLGSPKVLASAPDGRAIGVARLDARLKLLIPATVSDGRFTATLTFTVI